MLLAIIIAVFIPGLFLFAIRSLDTYAMSRLSLLVAAIGWGIVAFGLALILQSLLLDDHIFTFEEITDRNAPFLEEGLKACLFIWLVRHKLIRHATDSIVYGFAIGTGFAVAENLLYIAQNPTNTLNVVLGRVLSANLLHAFNTAFIGTVVGLNIYQRNRARILRLILTLAAVILVHSVFDEIATDLTGEWLIALSIGIGLGGTGIIILILRHVSETEHHLDNS